MIINEYSLDDFLFKPFYFDFEIKNRKGLQYYFSYKLLDKYILFVSTEPISINDIIEIEMIDINDTSIIFSLKKSQIETTDKTLSVVSYRIPLDVDDIISIHKLKSIKSILAIRDGTTNSKISFVFIKDKDVDSLISIDLNNEYLINFYLS